MAIAKIKLGVHRVLEHALSLWGAWVQERFIPALGLCLMRDEWLPPLQGLPPRYALRLSYNAILHREPDPVGKSTYLPLLQSGQLSVAALSERLEFSEEWRVQMPRESLLSSLHVGRCEFIQGLPSAQRILDLGGTHLASVEGALVALGYPYDFDELVIVDLPQEKRHPLYRGSGQRDAVETARGPVRYRYHSMVDLDDYASDSFDLVYAGQSIEHVTKEEARKVLASVFRLLTPGGYLALDTPNAKVTRLQQESFIDPDHKYEYTHEELRDMFDECGLEIIEAKGINYAGSSLRRGSFSESEVASKWGLFREIEMCYLLAYVCQKPIS
ncbi:MAG: class I SAM-dependent methyltransferase [Actinobacteria bacterium]|jgi:SAM-dependent methyltransferase|nr:class I SAM-dependent methyltransferase [Actinomycetota bacterium]MCL6096038.1 class I SAM-dependent methyltransferase [Actinomycetota bacterium]